MGCCCCSCFYDKYIVSKNICIECRIKYCKYSIVSDVIINGNNDNIDQYKKQLNKFYLCNTFHTTIILKSYIDIDPIDSLEYKYHNNTILINIKDKDIIINGRHYRLTLNDISLPEHMLDNEYLNLVT